MWTNLFEFVYICSVNPIKPSIEGIFSSFTSFYEHETFFYTLKGPITYPFFALVYKPKRPDQYHHHDRILEFFNLRRWGYHCFTGFGEYGLRNQYFGNRPND